jgi:regulator of nonsense transcripts 2
MDIEFVVHDIFALCRPQWKIANNLDEAAKALQAAVAQDQKASGQEKTADAEDGLSGPSTEDELGLEDQEDDSDTEEEELEVCPNPIGFNPTQIH